MSQPLRRPSFGEILTKTEELLNQSTRISERGSARSEAEQIVLAALERERGQELSRTDLFSAANDIPTEETAMMVFALALERKRGMPLQYAVGFQHFLNHRYTVRPGVLIPRPETEVLVSEAVSSLTNTFQNKTTALRGFEIGIGCGAITIELLSEFPNLYMTASDVSTVALTLARENAENLLGKADVKKRLVFKKSANRKELFSNDILSLEPFDFFISNPPYLAGASEVEVDVLETEPPEALFSPTEDPLYCYREISTHAPRLLKPGAFVFLEIAHERADATLQLFSHAPWTEARLVLDLNSRPRVLVARVS